MSPKQQNRLTSVVKRFLDLIWVLFIGLAIIWPFVVGVIGLNIPADPSDRHTDMSAFLSLRVFAGADEELASVSAGLGDLLLSGRGDLILNNTKGNLGWWITGAISEVMLLIFLYGLKIMRRLFSSLVEGKAFTDENADRMKKIGYLFIGWNIIAPIMQYLGGRMILSDMAMSMPNVQLYPAFEINIAGLFTGLAIIVLSGVLLEAIALRKEQELTI